MKKFYKIIYSLLIIILITVAGCKEEPTPGLFSDVPTGPIGNAPTISSISPDAALAGVSTITINGTNFVSDTASVFVYFNGTPGKILSSSPTQITVISPPITGNNISVKVAVIGAELFSDPVIYVLKPAVAEFYVFNNTQIIPFGITSDNSGNVLASVTEFGKATGIKKIGIDSTVSLFAPPGSETFFNSLKIGPGNIIYATRRVPGILQVLEGQPSQTYASSSSGLKAGSIVDLDFDVNKNMWAGGKKLSSAPSNSIFRITPDKDIKAFSFDGGDISAVRVFNNYVYVASNNGSEQSVWRAQIISSDSLSTSEKYFDFSTNFPTGNITAITFAEDGDMYLGTDLTDPIIIVHVDKTYEPLYPDLLTKGSVYTFASGPGSYIYYTRQSAGAISAAGYISQTIFRVDLGKPVAPEYGKQ
jgi:IPT/TIG domain